jgi:GntR family transcriptional regulator
LNLNHTSEMLIDRDTPIPLYFQIARILQQEINQGKYQAGDYIPTEAELQKRFGVSRATVRQAIHDLVAGGLLERWRSKGTQVAGMRIEARMSDLASFTNEIVSSGLTLRTKILTFKRAAVPASAVEPLGLIPSEMVFTMERLRFVDDMPVAFEYWYAPEKYFPGLEASMFSETGLAQSTYYVLMKRYGTEITRAIDTVSPIVLDATTARHLKVEKNTPVLKRTRISFNSDKQPVNYSTGLYLIQLKFVQDANK